MYGLKLRKPKKHQWTMGSGKATAVLGADAAEINAKGDWLFDLVKELQNRFGFETFNCTVYAIYKALIALARFKGYADFPLNASERYGGVVTETGSTGNDPWRVAELTATMFGLIPEEKLPWTSENTPQHYFSPKPMDENLVALGQTLLAKYQIEPEWVFPPGNTLSAKEKHSKLKRALKRGPVAASVHAWAKASNDVYVKPAGERDNHLIWLPKFDGDYPIAHDQYEPFIKRLHPAYDFECAIVFFMRPNPTGKPPHIWKTLLWLISKGRVKEALALLIKKPAMPTTPAPEPLEPPISPAEPSNRERLYEAAKASLGADLTPTDAIPDEVACVDQLQAVFHKATGTYIGVDAAHYNTLALKRACDVDSRMRSIAPSDALYGDIAICPTSLGKNPKEHGHCWIVGKRNWMSNDSKTGLWSANMTRDSVVNAFVKKRGFPLFIYRYER